ncbi:MAG: hypothetical protein P8Y70_14170 [Candidatus Lokiarchaeota archaeon]
MLKCEWCHKSFGKKGKIFKHINITQEESVHLFCSLKCKDEWMVSFQSEKDKLGIEWLLGTYKERTFFLKRYVHIPFNKEINSWFSDDLNHPLPLKAVKKGSKYILKVNKEVIF